jgi:hypothetical protein
VGLLEILEQGKKDQSLIWQQASDGLLDLTHSIEMFNHQMRIAAMIQPVILSPTAAVKIVGSAV